MTSKRWSQPAFAIATSLIQVCAYSGVLLMGGCAYTAMSNMWGEVMDSVTKQPIPGAKMDIYGRDGVEEHLTTDSYGGFALKGELHYGLFFRLNPELLVRISAPCYQTFEKVIVSGFRTPPPHLLPLELSPTCGENAGKPPPPEQFVMCDSNGKRGWTYRSRCDPGSEVKTQEELRRR